MNDVRSKRHRDFTEQQLGVLVNFVDHLNETNPGSRIDYNIVGFAEVHDRNAATSFIDSLMKEDWPAASAHQEFAGTTDLVIGVLLKVQNRDEARAYWVALSAPFEILQPATVLAWGRLHRVPDMTWNLLDKGVEE